MTKLLTFFMLAFLACSKESPLQPIDYDLDSSELPAAKVICDSLDHEADHVTLDSLLAVIDSLRTIEDSLSITDSLSAEGFSINLIFVDEFTEEQKALVRAAADRWEEIIVGDIPDVTYEEPILGELPSPLEGEVTHPAGEIDDLSVLVFGHTRDQASRSVLSNVIEFRDEGVGLPLVSVISINMDRYEVLVEEGYMLSLIQHELGHNLGFIPLLIGFEVRSYPSFTGDFNWRGGYLYEGVNATETFLQLLKGTSLFRSTPNVVGVPLGKNYEFRPPYGGHWRSEVFDNELMTGVYRGDQDQRPLSKLTISLMEDLGYEVDYDQADEYFLPRSGALGKPVVQEADLDLSCGHQL